MEDFPKGIVYLGNLPHGFYEENIRDFLSQFGEISRLKVKRSNKNAKPMGYAYIEFIHKKVATVVANTLHNYLMYSKLLKCRLVKGDSDKIFRRSNLNAEFCNGTKRKRNNQHKLENVSEESILKKAEKTKSKLSKALGMKIDSHFLIQDLKNEVSESKETDLSGGGELNKKFGSQKGKHSSQDNPVMKRRQNRKRKRNNTNMKDCTSTNETPNPQKKKKDHMDSSIKETPIYMDIEGEDDEIQFKTPPNVIKRFKKNTKIGSLKKKILGSTKKSKPIKDNGSISPSNDAKQVGTDSKKRKGVRMNTKDKADTLKLDSVNKTDSNILKKKNRTKNKNLKAKKFNSVSQSIDNITECLSSNIADKSMKLKRKAESVADKQTLMSKKFKLSSKKIRKARNPNSKSHVMLVSFKKKTVGA